MLAEHLHGARQREGRSRPIHGAAVQVEAGDIELSQVDLGDGPANGVSAWIYQPQVLQQEPDRLVEQPRLGGQLGAAPPTSRSIT